MGDVVGDLNRRRGIILGMDEIPTGKTVRSEVPLSEMFGYATDLRSATQGRASFSKNLPYLEWLTVNQLHIQTSQIMELLILLFFL